MPIIFQKFIPPLKWKKIEEIEIDCIGSGTKEDPYIIDSEYIHTDMKLMEFDSYLIIRNCSFSSMEFYYCKNITLVDCEYAFIIFHYCSNFEIKNLECEHTLFFKCENFSLDKIGAFQLDLYKLDNSILKNLDVYNFFNLDNLSRGNKLENIKFADVVYPPPDDYEDDELELYNKLSFHIELEDIDKQPILEDKTFTISTHLFENIPCIGTGIKEDPIIIEDIDVTKKVISPLVTNKTYQSILLTNNRHYIIFKNFNPKQIRLFDTQNISFESCTISNLLTLHYCKSLNFNNCIIRNVEIGECEEIIFVNSEINRIKEKKNFKRSISLKSCIVNKSPKNL